MATFNSKANFICILFDQHFIHNSGRFTQTKFVELYRYLPYYPCKGLPEFGRKPTVSCGICVVSIFLSHSLFLQTVISMSKARRLVTVEKSRSLSDSSEKRKPSVFERLGSAPGRSSGSSSTPQVHSPPPASRETFFSVFRCIWITSGWGLPTRVCFWLLSHFLNGNKRFQWRIGVDRPSHDVDCVVEKSVLK